MTESPVVTELLVTRKDSINIWRALRSGDSQNQTVGMMHDVASRSSPDKARVCILLPSHWAAAMGGAEYQVKLLLDELVAHKDINVWYLARNIDDSYRAKSYEICRIGNSTGMRYLLDAPGIWKALKAIRPHTIYCRVGTAYLGIAAAYCKYNDCRLVWHVAQLDDVRKAELSLRGLGFPILDKLALEYGLRRADTIVVQSQEQTDALKTNYAREATELIKNFHPASEEKIDKGGRTTVLWIGNLKRIKQPDLFIDIANRLSESGARFVMIGGNQLPADEYSRLQQRISSNPSIEYLGAIDQDLVNAYLAQAHVLINTSQTEGFSNTFIQAWMREVPVVSLNSDPDDLLAKGGLGFFAEGSIDLLVNQLSKLMSDSLLRTQIGKAGAKYAVQEHGLHNANRLIELLA